MVKCIILESRFTQSVPHTEDQQQLLVWNLCQLHRRHVDENVAEERATLCQRETAESERVREAPRNVVCLLRIATVRGAVSADQCERRIAAELLRRSRLHQLDKPFLHGHQLLLDDLRRCLVEAEEDGHTVVVGEERDDMRFGEGQHAGKQVASLLQRVRAVLLEERLVLIQVPRVVHKEARGERRIRIQLVVSHHAIVLVTITVQALLTIRVQALLTIPPAISAGLRLETTLRVLLRQLSRRGLRTLLHVVQQRGDGAAGMASQSGEVGTAFRAVALRDHGEEEVVSVDSVHREKETSLVHQNAADVGRFFVSSGKKAVPGFVYSSRSQPTSMTPGTGRTKKLELLVNT